MTHFASMHAPKTWLYTRHLLWMHSYLIPGHPRVCGIGPTILSGENMQQLSETSLTRITDGILVHYNLHASESKLQEFQIESMATRMNWSRVRCQISSCDRAFSGHAGSSGFENTGIAVCGLYGGYLPVIIEFSAIHVTCACGGPLFVNVLCQPS